MGVVAPLAAWLHWCGWPELALICVTTDKVVCCGHMASSWEQKSSPLNWATDRQYRAEINARGTVSSLTNVYSIYSIYTVWVGRSRVPGSGDKTRRSGSPLLCTTSLRLNDPVRPPWEENLRARQQPHKPRWPTAQTNKSAPPLPPANLDGSFTFPVVAHLVTWISVLRKLHSVSRGSNASIRHAIDWGSCVTDQPDTRGVATGYWFGSVSVGSFCTLNSFHR